MRFARIRISFLLPLLVAILYFLTIPSNHIHAQTIIINPNTTFQTITGWEASHGVGQDEPSYSTFKNHFNDPGGLFDQAVELGITRLRVVVKSGAENSHDYWADYRDAGFPLGSTCADPEDYARCPYKRWRCHRYAMVDDNTSTDVINWNGFHFGELDRDVRDIVIPFKQKLASKGRSLHINFIHNAFRGQMTENGCPSGLQYILDGNPPNYAEFMLASTLYLRNTFGSQGINPNTWEVILEPDLSGWNGTEIGNAIVATASKLTANGFNPRFVAPSVTNMANTVGYFNAINAVPGALQYLEELSYHRYGGVSDANLQAIASLGTQYGVNTSMLEHRGSGYQDLHKDLILGNNSSWEQHVLAGANVDQAGKLLLMDLTNPNNPIISYANRTKTLYQYFHNIHPGAVRIGASPTTSTNYLPSAFINNPGNPNQQYVAIVGLEQVANGTPFTVGNLPIGSYRVTYSTNNTGSGSGLTYVPYNVLPGTYNVTSSQPNLSITKPDASNSAVVAIVQNVVSVPTPTATPTPSPNPNDLTGEGIVDLQDIIRLIVYIFNPSTQLAPGSNPNIDGSNSVNLLDVIAIVSIIFS